jgi:hypothetical protein
VGLLLDGLSFLAAMAASLLPSRLWGRLPDSFQMTRAAFVSGLATFFLAAAIGLPGFYHHAKVRVSETNAAILKLAERQIASGMREGDPREVKFETGLNMFAIFSFLLLTPTGWLTMYLGGTGAFRTIAAWFDDPVGDPVLTGIDEILWRQGDRVRVTSARLRRTALEGPETRDRVVSGAKAEIPGCDLVIVSSRRKPGWERGVAVYTQEACYRIGEPVERAIAGKLRTLYPLTKHTDLEVIRKSVHYDMPDAHPRD